MCKTCLTLSPNPCDQIYVRGIKRTIPKELLTDIELKSIYDTYPENSLARIRDKVMFGLLSCQGMTMGEIIRLDQMDIQVEVGYIRIRPTKKSNGRTIKLEEIQRSILTRYDVSATSQCDPQLAQTVQYAGSSVHDRSSIHLVYRAVL